MSDERRVYNSITGNISLNGAQGCQVAWDQSCQILFEKLPKVAKQVFSHNDVTKLSRMRT